MPPPGLPRLQRVNSTKFYHFDGPIATQNLKFDRLLFHMTDEPLDTVSLEEPPLVIASSEKRQTIFVDEINGVPWDKFVRSVYRKSKASVVKGKPLFHVSFDILTNPLIQIKRQTTLHQLGDNQKSANQSNQ